jgi:hypothetical protein
MQLNNNNREELINLDDLLNDPVVMNNMKIKLKKAIDNYEKDYIVPRLKASSLKVSNIINNINIDYNNVKQLDDIIKEHTNEHVKRKCTNNDTDNKKQRTNIIKQRTDFIKKNHVLYQKIESYFYTQDVYIIELLNVFLKKYKNIKEFLENVFPEMSIEDILNLKIKILLNKMIDKNMLKIFVNMWFNHFIEHIL